MQGLHHLQLFPHVAGQKFLGGDIGVDRKVKLRRGNFLRRKTAADIPVNDPGQLLYQFLLAFSGAFRHKGEIDLRFFRKRYRQRLRSRVHLRHRHIGPDGPLGEHIRLAGKIALVIQHLQRAQQGIAAVVRKGQMIATGAEPPVFPHIGIIQTAKFFLFLPNDLVRMIFHLIGDELAGAVPQRHHAPDPVLGGERQIDRLHAAVDAEIQLAVHRGKAVIPYIRVGGDGEVFLLWPVLFIGGYLCVKPGHGLIQQVGKVVPFTGPAHAVHTVLGALHDHLAQHHFRVPDEIAVHADAVFIRVQMHPIRFDVHDAVTFLKEENVTGHIRPGAGLEGRIGQADRPDEVGPLGQIFPHGGAFLVHCTF